MPGHFWKLVKRRNKSALLLGYLIFVCLKLWFSEVPLKLRVGGGTSIIQARETDQRSHMVDLKETESEENYVRRLTTGLCTEWNNNHAAFRWWSGLV
tara:strand:+ start:319 stop:609 length:291 start_codon:yes stop_codon:yes gene_type:complete